MMNRDEGELGRDRLRSGEAMDCDSVRDLLPLHHLGLLQPGENGEIARHLPGCAECRGESELVARLQEVRPEPPVGLRERIVSATSVEVERGAHRGSGWRWGSAVAAAAAVVLALGWGTLRGPSTGTEELWTIALEPEATMRWYGNDWVVAGEPQLTELPDELLREILEEMSR